VRNVETTIRGINRKKKLEDEIETNLYFKMFLRNLDFIFILPLFLKISLETPV